eukprot:gene534-1019_t
MHFASNDIRIDPHIWDKGAFCYRHGSMLAHGVRGLELFWAIMWNPKFQGCLEGLVSALVDSRSHFSSFHNVFVRCRLEEIFVNFHSDIHSRVQSKYQRDENNLGIQLRNIDECLMLLQAYVAEFISGKVDHTTSVNKWEPPGVASPVRPSQCVNFVSDAVTSQFVKCFEFREWVGPLSFTVVATCQWHLVSLFGLTVKGQLVVCNKSSACSRFHATNLKSYTRDKAVVLSSTYLPKSFKAPLQSLITARPASEGPHYGRERYCGWWRGWVNEDRGGGVVVPEALSSPTGLAGGRSGPPLLLHPFSSALGSEQAGWCAARLRRGSRTPVDFFNDTRLALGIPSTTWLGAGDVRGRSHTRVAPSALPDAGLGAFARELLEPDVWIGSYSGTSWGQGPDTRYRVEYGDLRVDAMTASGLRCRVAYINDPCDERMENVRITVVGKALRVHTLCEVLKGAEFYMAYGGDYWLQRASDLSPELFLAARRRYGVGVQAEARKAAAKSRFLAARSTALVPLATWVPSTDGRLFQFTDKPPIGWTCAFGARGVQAEQDFVSDLLDCCSTDSTHSGNDEGNDSDDSRWDDYFEDLRDHVYDEEVDLVTAGTPLTDAAFITQQALEVSSWATRLFPTHSSFLSVGGVRQVVQPAFDHNAEAKSLRDAAAWAHGYKLERMWVEADTQLLSQLSSVVAVAAFRCRLTCSSRLSPDRVHHWVSLDNPDYDRILRLAPTGMPLLADPDFKPNMGAPGPLLAGSVLQVLPAVQKMMIEQYRASGQCILLNKSDVTQSWHKRIGNASLVFVLLCLSQKLVVSHTQHLPGTANGKADALSQVGHPGGMTWTQLLESEMGKDLKKHQAKEYEVDARPIIALCNPAIQIGDMDQFVSFWMDVQNVLESDEERIRREYIQREEEGVRAMLTRSVARGTQSRIAYSLRERRAFLDEHVGEGADTYMDDLTDVSKKGCREQIKLKISQVRSGFSLAGEGVSFFDSDLVERGKRGGKMTTDEVREAQSRSAEVEKYPMNIDMILEHREAFWTPRVWDAKALDRKAVWLAMALCLDSGLRVGNATSAEKNQEDHCIRAHQVFFELQHGGKPSEWCPGGEEFRVTMFSQSWMVMSATFRYSSKKTSNICGNGVRDPKWLGRRSAEESDLLNDVI